MAEQRRVQSADRRRPSSPFSSLHGLRGRRRSFRRDADRVNPRLSLDWHAPQLLVLTIGIMLLCLADAHNTLQLIKAGAGGGGRGGGGRRARGARPGGGGK